jgi:hypothetical protein
VSRLLGESRLFYGFARPIGCLVTLGTGMVPNIAFADEGDGFWSNLSGTAKVCWSMFKLSTTSETANQTAERLVEKDTYYRFNIGKHKEWIEKVYPAGTSLAAKLWTKKIEKRHVDETDWNDLKIDLAGEFLFATQCSFSCAYFI